MENFNDENLGVRKEFNDNQKDGFQDGNIENKKEIQDNRPRSTSLSQPGEMSSISVLFQKAFEVYKFNFWKFTVIVLLPVAFCLLVMVIFGSMIGTFFMTINSLSFIAYVIGSSAWIVFILAFEFLIIVALVSQSSLFVLVRDSSKKLNFKELIFLGKDNAVGIFTIKFIKSVFIYNWTLLLIIPGIIMSVYYSFASWVYLYEGKRDLEAIKRSKELVKEHWWSVFGRLVLVYVIFLAMLGLTIFLSFLLETPILLLIIPFLAIAYVPFYMCYSCFVYWDLIRIKGN